MATLQQQQDDENQGQPGVLGSLAPTTGGGPIASQTPNTQQPQKKGSGRFVNLQKYIGANQGAGEQLGSRVGGMVEKQYQKGAGQAETQAQKVTQGIQQGQQVFGQGGQASQIQQQMQQIGQGGYQGYDARQFVQSPEFQQYQTILGRGEGGDAFNQQQMMQDVNQYQNILDQTGQQLQSNIQNLGTEQGRNLLLQQAVRNPGQAYTGGQRRLDNLFLQSAPGNQVGKLQQQARQKEDALRMLTGQYANLGQDVETLTELEAQMQQQLMDQARGLETGYIDAMKQQMDVVNQQRKAEQDRLNKFYDAIQGKEVSGLSQEDYDILAQKYGLESGMKTYGALPKLSQRNLGSMGQMAQDFRDIATQQDVDKYAALAQLVGLSDPSQYQLYKVGQLDSAVKYNEDAIKSAINKEREALLNRAKKQKYTLGDFISGEVGPHLTKIGVLKPSIDPKSIRRFNLRDFIDKLDSGKNLNELLNMSDIVENFDQLDTQSGWMSRGRMERKLDKRIKDIVGSWLKSNKYYDTYTGPKFKEENLENNNYFNVGGE